MNLLPKLVRSIMINTHRSNELIDQDMLMTDQAYEMVQSGIPFRDAYSKVKSNRDKNVPLKNISRQKSSSGSAYNLSLQVLKSRLIKLSKNQ